MNDHYFYLPGAFQAPYEERPRPEDYKNDTDFPELNSKDFGRQYLTKYREPNDFLPFFCFIDYMEGSFVVASNNFTTEIWDGSLITTDNFESIVNHNIEKTNLQIPVHSTITALKYLDKEHFLMTSMDSKIYLYNTTVIKRKQKGSSSNSEKPIVLNSVKGTQGYGMCIAELQKDLKFIVGTNRGHLEIFDYNIMELTLGPKYTQAHGSAVTGVSGHPTSPTVWASSSTDRNCMIWDSRKGTKLASRILKDYEHQLTAVYCTKQEENNELFMVGDEAGYILTLDPRYPNKILYKSRAAKRPIKKFCFNGTKRFGVVTKSASTSFYEIKDTEPELIHNHNAPGMVYSMCSDHSDKSSFYVVGEAKYAEQICLN